MFAFFAFISVCRAVLGFMSEDYHAVQVGLLSATFWCVINWLVTPRQKS